MADKMEKKTNNGEQNITKKTKDWETQSTLNKTLHRKLKIEKHKVH